MNNIDMVKMAQSGNDEAFLKLIDNCKKMLYRIAFAYLKNENDAIDILSDTIYKAYMDINKLKNPQYFDTWITKILINSSINKLNIDKKVIYIDEYSKLQNFNDNSEEITCEIPENIDLINAIDKLNFKLKTIIILKYFKDMTISQISDVLNCPEGTIKVYIHRALNKLKTELKEGNCLNE